jgi:hypothetical protein
VVVIDVVVGDAVVVAVSGDLEQPPRVTAIAHTPATTTPLLM